MRLPELDPFIPRTVKVPSNKTELEAEQIMKWWYSINPGHSRTRVVSRVAKVLMLKESMIVKGYIFEIRCKSVGAGVYEVWLEKEGKR